VQLGRDFLRLNISSAGATSSCTKAGSFGSKSGRLSRRNASMRRLRAMVKIQVEAAPLAGSKRSALFQTATMVSCISSSAR